MKKSLFFLAAGFSVLVCLWGWTRLDQEEIEIAETQRTRLFSETDWRNPAAIRKSYDFSKLSGSALKTAGQKRLLKDIKLAWEKERVGIELGHFVVKGESGNKEFACAFYDRVLFEFVAEGMAENGHIPQMTIEGPCEVSKNINRMEPVWLPVDQLRQLKPGELKGRFFPHEKVTVHVEHASSAWPKTWRLQSLKVFNQVNSQRVLEVGDEKVREHLSNSLTLSW